MDNKTLDKKTLNLFRELSEDGASIDNVGSKNIFLTIIANNGEIPKEKDYDKSYLLKSDQKTKDLALKIISERERDFANLIIKTAKNKLEEGKDIPVGLLCLAWQISSGSAKEAITQLGAKDMLHTLTMPSQTPQELLPMLNQDQP
jgi:hypothetical protein